MAEELTIEAIDKLEAGRETDALVAKKAMGWTRATLQGHLGQVDTWEPPDDHPEWQISVPEHYPPSYSEDISAAWEVVEKIRGASEQIRERFTWEIELTAYGGDSTVAQIRMGRGHYPEALLRIIMPTPLAICRAALKAVTNA